MFRPQAGILDSCRHVGFTGTIRIGLGHGGRESRRHGLDRPYSAHCGHSLRTHRDVTHAAADDITGHAIVCVDEGTRLVSLGLYTFRRMTLLHHTALTHSYADYSKLYVSVRATMVQALCHFGRSLTKCVAHLDRWMITNRPRLK